MQRISDSWVNKGGVSKDAAGWDARADTFNGPIASMNEPFVSLIYDVANPNKDSTEILDIGSGTGRFSLAFVNDAKRILGYDLSPVMVGMANERPEVKDNPNVEFRAADWDVLDVSDIGRFNLTIANMPPAICSKSTFEKMLSLSDGWCFLSGHISRGEGRWGELNRLVGKELPVESNKLLFVMDMLWEKGLDPVIRYTTGKHKRTMPADYAEKSFLEAASKMPDNTPEKEQRIKDIIASLTENGNLVMDSSPTSAMLYWHM